MERGLIHNRLPLCATVRTFMPEFVRVRTIQLLMGCLYTCVGTIALARLPSWALVMFSLASALGSYVTAKVVDNATIPKNKILRTCGFGLIVAAIAIVSIASGIIRCAEMSAIIMGYCAGNRFKAGGLAQAN